MRFDNIDDVKIKTRMKLSAITEDEHKKSFAQWNDRLIKYINSN